ncbi:MAG: hypothetical protein RRB13_09330 [bacterium]|nr:hypothetical protein [bacterium]
MKNLRLSLYAFYVLFVFFFGQIAWAQQNYVSLKEGEYETRQAPRPNIEDAIISGNYEASMVDRRLQLSGKPQSNDSRQDFELSFTSNLHDHIHLKATLANYSSYLSEQAEGYQSDQLVEQGDSSTDTAMNVFFKEAYLQYEHNPAAVLRLGQQEFDLGDKLGLTYRGISQGFSQTCRVGTWCYMIGAVRFGRGVGDNLLYAQLTYPVYEQGQVFFDSFESKERQRSALYIEIFRHFYRGSEIPLALYGGRTGNGTSYQATSNGKPVYFENKKMEYFGVNGTWNYYDYQLLVNYAGMAGDRFYWEGNQGDSERDFLAHRHLAGGVWRLEQRYMLGENWQTRLTYLSGRGGEQLTQSENYWDRDRTDYLEVQKGFYGDALIYFNGLHGSGDGHSVSNLNYQSLFFNYRNPENQWGVDIRFYQYAHNKTVINDTGERVMKIGQEFNVEYQVEMDKNLTANLAWGYFVPEEAYSANDNLAPSSERTSRFSLYGAQLRYHF